MKKTVIIILLTLFCAVTAFVGLDLSADKYKETNIYSTKGYIDYAEKVFFDKEKYPETEEMGLFWTRWDDEKNEIVQVPADSPEGAALVDPSKPTILNVHGVLLNGYTYQEKYKLNAKIANPAEFDIDADYVSMNYLWLREGWNVANFHYNRFAAEMSPTNIEGKIWSTDGEFGMRYQYQDKTYTDNNVSEYCLAEHFAAEYIRAMRLLPESMGGEEIRFAAHSMGGMLTTASLFLLTELAADGQLAKTQLPERFALLDSYFSTTMNGENGTIFLGPKDITIRWSGKNLVKNNTGDTMMTCLKSIAEKGIVLEYYTYETMNFLLMGALPYAEELRKISTYAVVNPDFQGPGYSVTKDGHNGVREWYLCSLLDEPLKDITDGDNDALAPSAALPTHLLPTLYNKEFQIVDGTNTVRADDDTMMRRFKILYETNGGTNSYQNPDKYIPNGGNITIKPAVKRDATFDGWYLNADFSGEKITELEVNAKTNYKLYAKWK